MSLTPKPHIQFPLDQWQYTVPLEAALNTIFPDPSFALRHDE